MPTDCKTSKFSFSPTTSLPKAKQPEATNIRDDPWFNSELDRVKREAIEEFEHFNRVELGAYEEQLEQNLLKQLEEDEQEFNSEADRIDAESDLILGELTELNAQLAMIKSAEYDKVIKENQILNDRLISLSSSMCLFSELPENDQDRLIASYSVRSLEKQIAAAKADIRSYRR